MCCVLYEGGICMFEIMMCMLVVLDVICVVVKDLGSDVIVGVGMFMWLEYFV